MKLKTLSNDSALTQLVAALVALEFDVECPHMFSAKKGPSSLSFARQVTMYLVHVVYQINLSRVARVFKRDRTTVSHACHMVEDCREDPLFDEKIMRLETFLVTAPLKRSVRQ